MLRKIIYSLMILAYVLLGAIALENLYDIVPNHVDDILTAINAE